MLLAAVNGLRDQVEASRLPLALPDAPAAGKVRLELLQQLDDYVIPITIIGAWYFTRLDLHFSDLNTPAKAPPTP